MDVTHLSEEQHAELDAKIAKTTDLTHFDMEKNMMAEKTESLGGSGSETIEEVR